MAIASGGSAWSLGPTTATEPDRHPARPFFSEREHAVLMAYASGRTLDSTARHLKRIKAKYHLAGLPVHTKLELAARVRADCAGGMCPATAPRQGRTGIANKVSPEMGRDSDLAAQRLAPRARSMSIWARFSVLWGTSILLKLEH